MALTFVSSDPTSGNTDWYINKSIQLTYNIDISPASLIDSVVFLVDLSTNQNVPCSMALLATDPKVIIMTPLVNLKENSNYRAVVVGTDQLVGYSLSATNGDTLTATTKILFSTGNNVYTIDTVIEKQAANLTLEGDLFLPTNIKALGYEFTLDKVRPKNHTHGVSGQLTGDNTIRFTFTKDLQTGEVYSDWVSVNAYPILQDLTYIGAGGETGNPLNPIPGYTVSATGPDLLVVFNTGLPQNVCVNINLNNDITSQDNDQYGGNLNYVINTELSVQAFGPEVVKMELNSIRSQLYDDYIGALLFKNSMYLWEKTGRSIDTTALSWPAKRWILLSTLLDIMEDQDYHKFVLGGTRRQLGDLNVSVDNPIGRLALKIARTQKERDIAFESLFKGWQFKALAGADRSSSFAGDRLWYSPNWRYTNPVYKYYQPDLPVSNLSQNRAAKTNNPFW